ncbi:MAG: carboxypeptidase-like regulatory domain-containing protein [Candidatus Roizmanbacteria bacterium]|nr:carboxypeptidase-like regulatory domain-containing protein [Candidatus Roizmanbacteria bacterium]
MNENTKQKKTALSNSPAFLHRVKSWFHALSTGQKSMVIFAGIGLLLILYIISVLVRYGGSSTTSLSDSTTIQGKVMDQNGEPIDGAIITGSDTTAMTFPDGTFTIPSTTNDTFAVSAFGYETTHVSASEPSVTLSALAPGTVRLVVIGPENQELRDTLVYRLNANTFVPVSIGLTDQSGEIVFQNIPSGQAAFAVLHPDYGFGWLVTSLDPGEAIRPVIRFMPVTEERESARTDPKFINTAYAQAPTNSAFSVSGKIGYRIATDEKLDDNTYSVVQQSETILAIGTDKDHLQRYIELIKGINTDNKSIFNYDYAGEAMQKIYEVREKEGIQSPITIIRISQSPSDEMKYQIDYGWKQDGQETYVARKIDQRNYLVEIKRPTTEEAMSFLQARYAQNEAIRATLVSWSQVSGPDLASAEILSIDPTHRSVCCYRPEVQGESTEGISIEASSNETPPSNITLTKPDNTAEYLKYSHKEINEMFGRPNLVTVANSILEENPTLTFVDETGNEFSFLDVTAPNPNDAPPAFLLDFFENRSKAVSNYLDDKVSYQRKWKQFMAAVGSEAFQKQGVTPSEFKRSLLNDYGTRSAWRLEEEKRLAQQASKQGSGQQDANQQSAPDTMQDSGQQSGETDSSDSQFEDPQVEITESPDPESDSGEDDQALQDDQQQGENSGSQGSGTGANNSNQGGNYNGPQGVQSR